MTLPLSRCDVDAEDERDDLVGFSIELADRHGASLLGTQVGRDDRVRVVAYVAGADEFESRETPDRDVTHTDEQSRQADHERTRAAQELELGRRLLVGEHLRHADRGNARAPAADAGVADRRSRIHEQDDPFAVREAVEQAGGLGVRNSRGFEKRSSGQGASL